MTKQDREFAKSRIKYLLLADNCLDKHDRESLEMAIKALSQEPSRNMEEIAEVIKSDVDAETKCKMISNILTAKPHYFEKQEPTFDDECQIDMDEAWEQIQKKRKRIPITQKSGKWEDLHRCWVCSECGQQTHIEHKYCPNCGAKMESEG